MEAKADFLAAGGTEFRYIECLNETPAWIQAMAGVVESHSGGWPVSMSLEQQEALHADREAGRLRALELGAEK